jgi:hypothetical protein
MEGVLGIMGLTVSGFRSEAIIIPMDKTHGNNRIMPMESFFENN